MRLVALATYVHTSTHEKGTKINCSWLSFHGSQSTCKNYEALEPYMYTIFLSYSMLYT